MIEESSKRIPPISVKFNPPLIFKSSYEGRPKQGAFAYIIASGEFGNSYSAKRKMIEVLSKYIKDFLSLRAGKNIMLIRHGESMGHYAGTLIGWTDSKLTIKGREQAHSLYPALYKEVDQFTGVYSSDLVRAHETGQIALGFTKNHLIRTDKRVRELYFGSDEGKHFDSMPEEEKNLINSIHYKAPGGGESWLDVRKRAVGFFKDELKNPGNYLIFTHGGLMCSLTWFIGLQDVMPHGSALGLKLDDNSEPKEILFKWIMDQERKRPGK